MDNVIALQTATSKRFLQNLKEHPFLAIVLDDNQAIIYVKDLDSSKVEDLRIILLEELNAEEMYADET